MNGGANHVGTVFAIVPGPMPVQFVTLPPCRVVDTRNPDGPFGGPAINGGTARSFPLEQSGNPCDIPSNAVAYSLNVTVVPQGALAYLTAWPTGQLQPVVSTLNSFDGTILANAAIVPAGSNGSASFYGRLDNSLTLLFCHVRLQRNLDTPKPALLSRCVP